ncbi:AlpA family phage regulatory protein [Sphingorhabdus sp. IMCC26285]|uniref:AlpA family phage regulatory protein n=1 Tax=Sphingorhabdus profundilacus TaxID=2509718 RepID=A0A6I4M0Q5_9SPHN|nr:AlpA family phage regulatory protein [Sphingorhabdus profundilacus]MVZ97933.1 AlpA family phage regulatory protein [Sphingorhabdus profundilacus]
MLEHQNPRFLRLPEVLARVGVSYNTISRWEEQGIFPKRRHLGPNSVGWLEHEVNEWCASRKTREDAEAL